MKENFDPIKDLWLSGKDQSPRIETIREEILQLRKQKKDRIIIWYFGIFCFSLLVILYVIYTDDLNSIYKSISEFILLFTGTFLLYHSWKSIQQQQKEYFLDGQEFLHRIKDKRIKSEKKKIFIGCISSSLFMTAVFLYFFDLLMANPEMLVTSSILLGIAIALIWFVARPFYEKKRVKNSDVFINTIERLLQDIQ